MSLLKTAQRDPKGPSSFETGPPKEYSGAGQVGIDIHSRPIWYCYH